MWKRLSLRTRIFLPLGLIVALALVVGGFLLQLFTAGQLIEENEPALRATRLVAEALNGALKASANPEQTLEAFVKSLGRTSSIQFRRLDSPWSSPAPSPAGVPQWFVRLLTIPEMNAAFPIEIGGRHVGDIVFAADINADISEKWIGFVAFVSFVLALTMLTALIAYTTTGSALRPLQNLGAGLTRMRRGDYAQAIPLSGPPEIRRSCEEANELARTLAILSEDNRGLLRRLVSLQDDERRDLARELHDELGPLLFGIRANAVGLMEATPPQSQNLRAAAEAVLRSVEALQQASRRILDRLRPLYIQELGLEKSIQTLLQNFRSQAPQLELSASIHPDLNRVDGLVSQTVYRVIQEALTNVLRHARAARANVEARIERCEIVVEISDDGIGFPDRNRFGRGLTGMQERLRALSGSLELSRSDGKTHVRCRLPFADAPAVSAPLSS